MIEGLADAWTPAALGGSEIVAYVGAALLGVATLPQAIQLLRTRRAEDFHVGFAVLNLVGLACLTWRSLVIGEWAFFGVNVVTTSFWGLVALLKLGPGVSRPSAAPIDT